MLTLIKSPFIDYKLTILRNKKTSNSLFRQTMNEISYLIASEVLKHLNLVDNYSEPKYVATGPDDAEVVWDLDNVVGNVDDLTTDTSKLKTFATKKKLTHKDKVKAKKKQKYRQRLEEDTMEQIDYIENKHGPFQDPEPADDLFDEFGNLIE